LELKIKEKLDYLREQDRNSIQNTKQKKDK